MLNICISKSERGIVFIERGVMQIVCKRLQKRSKGTTEKPNAACVSYIDHPGFDHGSICVDRIYAPAIHSGLSDERSDSERYTSCFISRQREPAGIDTAGENSVVFMCFVRQGPFRPAVPLLAAQRKRIPCRVAAYEYSGSQGIAHCCNVCAGSDYPRVRRAVSGVADKEYSLCIEDRRNALSDDRNTLCGTD